MKYLVACLVAALAACSDSPAELSDGGVPDAAVPDASAPTADPTLSTLYTDRDLVIVGSAPVEVYVLLRDAHDAPIAGAHVQLAVTSGSVTIPPATDIAGQTRATWTNTVTGTFDVSLVVDGVTFATHTVEFTPGSAVGLAFDQQPPSILAGEMMSPQVSVFTIDEFGNRTIGGSGQVELSLEPNASSAMLTGNTASAIMSGTASFAALTVMRPGTGYRIRAHLENLADAVSDPFDVMLGDADMTRSTIVATPTSLQADGVEESTLALHLANAYGVPVPSAPVSLSVTGSNNVVSATSGMTNASGDFASTISSTTAEAKTVTATLGGLTLTTTLHFFGPFCTPQLPGPPGVVLPWDGKVLLADDFTGDGHVDAIIQDTLYRRSLYRGHGDGTFDPPIALSPPPWPVERLASADINADGILDLLMTPQNGGFVGIELGTGGGQFTASTAAQLVTGELEAATRFTIGDFNNDGHPDLAVASNTHKVVIELGAADGTFTTGQIIPNLDASDLAAAKLDGDGVVDLVVAGATGVTSLVGNGDGTFAAPVTLAGSAIGNLVISDFNSDGTPDCAVASQGWTLQAYLGSGTGTFTPVGTAIPTAQFNSTTSGTAEIRARDIDGDGHIDLVLGELPSLTILHGGGDGTFAIAHVYAAQAGSIGLADADGDGITDVLALGGPMLGILHGRGDGTFVAPESHREPDDRGGLFQTSADFDHDGRTDFVIETQQGIGALLAESGGTLTDAALVAETETPSDLRAGDVTGDGIADLVGIFPASTGITVRVANGAGDGTFAPFTTFALPFVDSKLLQLADVDRDGKQDLVLSVSAAHSYGAVLVARSLGDGTFGPATGFPGATTWAVAADFDGDGISDLLTTDGGGYSMWILYGDGAGGFGMPATSLHGDAGTPPLVADVDRDGRADVVLPGSDPMLGRTITVMRGLASRTLGPALVTTGVDADAFGSWRQNAVADLTGDGMLDLVALRESSLVVLPGYGDGYFAKHVSAYPATDALSNGRVANIAVSDVDQDGRTDILFWKGMGVGIAFNRGCLP